MRSELVELVLREPFVQAADVAAVVGQIDIAQIVGIHRPESGVDVRGGHELGQRVVLLEREDHVVALTALRRIQIGNLHQRLVFRHRRKIARHERLVLGRPRLAEAREYVLGRVDTDQVVAVRNDLPGGWVRHLGQLQHRNLHLVQPQEALIGRLHAPDRVHVVEDVVADVHQQSLHPGLVVEVATQGVVVLHS